MPEPLPGQATGRLDRKLMTSCRRPATCCSTLGPRTWSTDKTDASKTPQLAVVGDGHTAKTHLARVMARSRSSLAKLPSSRLSRSASHSWRSLCRRCKSTSPSCPKAPEDESLAPGQPIQTCVSTSPTATACRYRHSKQSHSLSSSQLYNHTKRMTIMSSAQLS